MDIDEGMIIKSWHVMWLAWGWHDIWDTQHQFHIKVRGPFRFVSIRL